MDNSLEKINTGAFSGCKALSSFIIPAKCTKINDSCFASCESLSSITIHDKVTSIGNSAFAGCLSLGSITIPTSVESLGSYAFSGCLSLSSVTLGKITAIKDHTFEFCQSLSGITIPLSVTSIETYAFAGCLSLMEITIPYTMKSVDDYAFNGCQFLTKVRMDRDLAEKLPEHTFYNSPGKDHIDVLDYAEVDDTATVGNFKYRVTNAAKNGSGTVVLWGVASSVANQSIPNTVWVKDCTYKVTRITANAFKGDTNLTTLFIGGNVTTIDSNAFAGCTSLVSVTGGSGLTTLGSKAFFGCSALTTLKITSSKLKKIGTYCFQSTPLLKTLFIQKTTKLTKAGVKNSLKSSALKTIRVKKAKVSAYKKYFAKANSGRKVTVKK